MRFLDIKIIICTFAKTKLYNLKKMDKITIPNRINWVDWAKVIAISFVVFGHIPMTPDNFPQRYITSFHMPLFFLISGYLTKKECFNISTLKKYWHTLIIPYIFYNIVFYPYWIVRHIIDVPDAVLSDYIRPIIGAVLFQLRTPISDPLNEVTWFVAVLLVMKIVLSIANLHKRRNQIMFILSIICALFYIYNEQYLISENLPIIGFNRCMPFFFLGHFCKQNEIIPTKPIKSDWLICIIGIGISLIAHNYITRTPSNLMSNALIYINALVAVIGTIGFCRILDNYRSTIIDNISLGTIVIMGLHWMLIGTTNFVLQKILQYDGGIAYPLYITIFLTLAFEAIIYPIILLFKNRYPFLLGKRTVRK